MFCHNCGKQIPDDTRFCHYCGAAQDEVQGAPEPAAQPIPSQPISNQPISSQPTAAGERERVVAGIFGALLCSLAGVVVMLVLRRIGYVASLSGIIMMVCTAWGYAHFGKVMSKKGIVFSVLIVIIMIYIGHGMYWSAIVLGSDLYNGARFFFSVGVLGLLKRNRGMFEAWQRGLFEQYAYAAVGMIFVVINLVRGNRAKKKN